MSTDYSEMTYAELQEACKAAEVSATGTKEVLIARLQEGGVEAAGEEKKEANTDKVSDSAVEKELRGDQAKMKEHLSKQPKVSIMIPYEAGVAPEQGEKIPFVVNLNGYRLSIKRGTYVEVPQQVADVVKERLESEGKIGRDLRIDSSATKTEALG